MIMTIKRASLVGCMLERERNHWVEGPMASLTKRSAADLRNAVPSGRASDDSSARICAAVTL